MSLVVDAGFVVAALADGGTDGRWAEELLSGADLKQTRFVLLRPGKRIPGAGLRRLLLAALHPPPMT